MTVRVFAAISVVVAAAISCSKGENAATTDTAQAAAPAAPSVPGGPATPAPGGKVIVVELITDAKGNYFSPSEIKAHQGDVIRYTLKIGVHNVHFLTDSNSIKTGLPPASEMLQLPGQTYDVPVNFPEGKYYFQCDPHAALGMKGHLEVED
ncbi:MAG: plastocyanin/azurin family copper-binding protein [Gemmatimonadaceae bacterium]